MTQEIWLPVVGYSGLYEVSNMGRVKSLTRSVKHSKGPTRVISEKVLRGAISSTGYPTVTLSGKGENGKHKQVHRLVMAAFIGPCPDSMEVAHNDGVKTNCSLSNIRYDTRAGNIADRKIQGGHNMGETSPLAKLTDSAVTAIRESDLSQSKLAAMHGVAQTTISFIKRGVTWRHLLDSKTRAAIKKLDEVA